MISKVVLAKLSPTMEEGTIVSWNKNEGDAVKVGDVLAVIETDKANMEMESLANGVLRKILVPAGGKAPIGSLIGVVADPNEDISSMLAKAGRAAPAPTRLAPASAAPAPASTGSRSCPGTHAGGRRGAAVAPRRAREGQPACPQHRRASERPAHRDQRAAAPAGAS